MSGPMDAIESVRGTREGTILAVLLTIAATSILMYFSAYLCFGFMLIALAMYGILAYFGVRDMKRLLLIGLMITFILGIVLMVQTFSILQVEETPSDASSGILVDGRVDPYRTDAGSIVTFSVTLVGGNGSEEVWLEYANAWDASEWTNVTMTYAGDGLYTYELETEAGLYNYRFLTGDGSTDDGTGIGAGPLTESDANVLQRLFVSSELYAFLYVYVIFAIFAWVFNWSRKTKERIRKEIAEENERKAEEPRVEEKFVCSECGAEVPIDAKECPSCGESFEEESKPVEMYECSECGGDVPADAKVCPHCGERFDD